MYRSVQCVPAVTHHEISAGCDKNRSDGDLIYYLAGDGSSDYSVMQGVPVGMFPALGLNSETLHIGNQNTPFDESYRDI